MDIQANPGPSQTSNITDLRSSAPVSEGNLNYILPTSADRKVYNRTDLLALRSCKYGQETQKLFMRLKTNGIFRYRGPRRYQGWSSVKRKPIPTLSERKFGHARGNYSDYHAGDSQNKTVNFGVLRSLPKLKDPKPYDKPFILSANNHDCVSAPCRISSTFSMAGHNKPCPRSGGVNFNNLISIQPAGTIQAVRSDLIRFTLLNTRSIRKKAMFLNDYVVENQIDLSAITETWLDVNNQQTANIINELCPVGFAFMHIPRMNKCGGGVGLLYNKCYKIEKQDVTSFESFEYMEVLLRTPATVLRIGVLYRPPPSTENGLTATMFFNEFPILLERLVVASGHLLLTGDFNYNVDDRSDSLASRFLDLLDSHNLIQHVSGPTHKDNHTLDLMITRACDDIIESWSTLNPHLSDHSAIHSKLSLVRPRPPKVKKQYRKIRGVDPIEFGNDVMASTLFFSPASNVNDLCDQYDSELSTVVDVHAPLKTCFVTPRPSAPWYCEEIAAEKRKRRKLERRLRKYRTEADKLLYADQCS